MKKSVLIPYEKYQRLIKREPNVNLLAQPDDSPSLAKRSDPGEREINDDISTLDRAKRSVTGR